MVVKVKEEKAELEEELIETKNKIFDLNEERETLIRRKKELSQNLDCDIKKLSELQDDIRLKSILKGAWGEKEVIELTYRHKTMKGYILFGSGVEKLLKEGRYVCILIWLSLTGDCECTR